MPPERSRGTRAASGLELPAQSGEWLARVAESVGGAFWIYDPQQSRVVHADPQLEALWGVGVEGLPGPVQGDEEPPANRLAQRLHALAEAVDAAPGTGELCLRRPDGSRVWIELRLRRFHDAEHGRELIVGVPVDVTDRKEPPAAAGPTRAELEDRVRERTAELQRTNERLAREVERRKRVEHELRTSSERLRALLDHSFDLLCEFDETGRIVEGNARVTEILGYSRDELTGLPFRTVAGVPGDAERLLAFLRSGKLRTRSGVSRVRARDGSVRQIEWCCIPTRAHGGGARLTVVARDVTSRAIAEQRFHDFFQSAPDACVVLDSRRTIVHFNRAAEKLFAVAAADVVGEDVSLLVPERYRVTNDAVLTRILEDPSCLRAAGSQRVRVRRIDGSEVPVEINLAPLSTDGDTCLVAAIRDLSARAREEDERKLLEAQLHQWQKFESLGALAGGIAHDFNNLLAAVMNYANLALTRTEGDTPARHDIEQIKVAARRMSELASQMLTYAGRGETHAEQVDLGEEIRQVRALLAASLPKSVTLDEAFAEGLPCSAIDPAQLRQIAVNLVVNATEALEGMQGRIGLRTGVIEGPDAAPLAGLLLLGQLPDRAVYLEVSDDGAGMEPGTMSRMFEPFYSTRSAGRGLGLAVVVGIVRRHGGAIGVQSRLGHGTRILVALPVSDAPPETVVAEAAPAVPVTGTRILLVDDERSVRESAEQLLAARGARIVACADGRSALRELRESVVGFDAVLLDLAMPGLPGDEVLREIRAMRRDLPVVLCTGYRPASGAGEAPRDPFLLVARKPYDLDEVLRWVQARSGSARGAGPAIRA